MKKTFFISTIILLVSVGQVFSQRHLEILDRGLVAIRTTSSKVFLSWRVLGSDPDNVSFNLYRDGALITPTPISGASNFEDNSSNSVSYSVKTVINGLETGESNTASIWTNNYLDIPMDVPAPMTMPDTSTCTYSPNDCSVGDVDGDGQYEIIVKWDPSNSKDNSQSGYTGDVFLDCYKLNGTKLWRIDLGKNIRAGAHYTDIEVEDFDGNGKAEIICKTAPGTIDGKGKFLSKGPASSDNDAADYRSTAGYILTGPEYLSCFSGLTGEELSTVNYQPGRGDVSAWGDSYGNRVDRFLACSAFLDGVYPSAVMCRGYYTRVVLAAWDFRNGQLTQRWVYDSNSPKGVNAKGQGNHNLSVGDIDNDGKDEIVYGACAFDDNGTCLYSTGLGHGDAMHLSDLDPDRKGLEVWEVHESTGALYGEEMHDARTGEIIWGTYTGSDNGRGMSGNLIPGNRGFEMWSASNSSIKSKNGTVLSTNKASMNFRIYWDGDLQDELLDGTSITKYGVGTLMTTSNCSSNNSTKSTPNLSADILGDWREEVIFRTTDNTKLRIFSTTTPTSYKLYTLMHDALYRNAIAWQNTGYNQPPHVGYYIGDDMDTPPVSSIYDNDLRWKNGSSNWDNSISPSWNDSLNNASVFKDGVKVLFDITTGADANVTLSGNLSPKQVKINSPYNVTLSGTGTLNGTMDLKKIGAGALTLNNQNDFTGNTTIWDGNFTNNGVLANSNVFIQPFVSVSGKGSFGKNMTLADKTTLSPGAATGECSKMTITGNLNELGKVTYKFDMKIINGLVSSYDTLQIGGNWSLNVNSIIELNPINGSVPKGKYAIFQCGGIFTGDLTKLKISGIPSYLSYSLKQEGSTIHLIVSQPAYLTWQGNVNGNWDNEKTSNWKIDDLTDTFSANDSVFFNDEAVLKTVNIIENLSPASILIDCNSNYTFSGTGAIVGTGKLTKDGTGKATISNTNTYTGKTIINEGTLEIDKITNGGVASAIGAATTDASNLILNGGKLILTGASHSTNRNFTLGENGGTISIANAATELTISGKITGNGPFIKDGTGKLSLSATNTYTGKTIINSGTIYFPSDAASTSALSSTDTIVFKGGTLSMYNSTTTANISKWNLNIPAGYNGVLNVDGNSQIQGSITGKGTLNYFTPYTSNILSSDVSQFNGTINVTTDTDGGSFLLYNANGFENAKINLYNYVTMMYRVTSDITIPIGDLVGYKNSILGAGGTGICTITWEIGARNANSTFNGTISNSQFSGTGAVAAISKVGSGTWTLTNANTFSGGTIINSGSIMVNNTTGSGLGTGNIEIASGGQLTGSGSVSGKVIVDGYGTFSPGNGIGTFTVNNDISVQTGGILNFDIDKSTSTQDLLNITGSMDMQGKLQINALNNTTFADGDSYKIINGTITGTPEEIIPNSPGEGLRWDLTDFNAGGTIKVKTITGLQNPEIISAIYPNPFKDFIQIKLNETAANLKISIFNLIGNEVYLKENVQTSDIRLDVSEIPSGIYLLKIKSDTNTYSQKIIKK